MKKHITKICTSLVAVPLLLVSNISRADTTSITPELNNFSKVELSVSSNTDIQMGNEYSVKITTDEENLEKIDVSVKRDSLIIKRKKGSWGFFASDKLKGSIDIEITMPNIEEMEINGSSDVAIEGVNNQELVLEINGSGNIDVTGQSDELEIEINGSGDVNMHEVNGKDVDVEINGSGDIELTSGTCENFDIEINGSGSVRAKDVVCQNAEVEINGSGDSTVHTVNSVTFDSHGSGSVDVYGKPKTVVDLAARRRSKVTVH